jgi:integrase
MMDAGLVRECLLFQLQYNTNLRVSDALRLRWGDVLDDDRNIVETVSLLEKKIAHTGRYKKVILNSQIRASLLNYYHRYKPKPREFIFRSQSNRIGYRNRPWTPNWPRRVFNEHAKKVGIKGHIGTHTPRKTFGWMAYNVLGIPLDEIMTLLNHTDPRVTALYCGLTEDRQREQYEKVAEVNCAADGLIRIDRLPDNPWREKTLARHRRRGYKKTKKKA